MKKNNPFFFSLRFRVHSRGEEIWLEKKHRENEDLATALERSDRAL